MGRLGSVLLVVAVLFLVSASYPTPIAVGSVGPPPGDKAKSGPAAPHGQLASVRAASDSGTSDLSSKESASQLLSRLKPKPDQLAAKSREPAVELPRRIKIPAIGVDAEFEYVGLAADGAMDVPKDPSHTAWYRLGPRPGEIGNAVVAGHVDWGGKIAVFWGLGRLKAGDTVEISAVDGRRYEFSVEWVRWYDADRAPVQEVFGQSDRKEITLITCGGTFDHKSRQYLSRVVVRAVLR